MQRDTLLAALGAVTMWGTGNLAIKLAVASAPPITLGGARALLGGLLLVALIYARGGSIGLPRSQFRWAALLGLLQITLMPSFFYAGIRYTTLSAAAIIIGTTPVQVALVEHFTLSQERLTPGKVAGLGAGLIGIVLIFWLDLQAQGLGNLLGDSMVLVSSMFFTSSILLVRRASQHVDILRLSAVSTVLGSIPALGAGLLLEGPRYGDLDLRFWLLFLYIAVFVTAVSYLLWCWALKRDAAGRVAVFLFLVPVWGILLGRLVLREHLSPNIVLGAVLVVLGITQVNRLALKRAQALAR